MKTASKTASNCESCDLFELESLRIRLEYDQSVEAALEGGGGKVRTYPSDGESEFRRKFEGIETGLGTSPRRKRVTPSDSADSELSNEYNMVENGSVDRFVRRDFVRASACAVPFLRGNFKSRYCTYVPLRRRTRVSSKIRKYRNRSQNIAPSKTRYTIGFA